MQTLFQHTDLYLFHQLLMLCIAALRYELNFGGLKSQHILLQQLSVWEIKQGKLNSDSDSLFHLLNSNMDLRQSPNQVIAFVLATNLYRFKSNLYLAKTKAALLAVHMSLEDSNFVSLIIASSKHSSRSIHIRHSPSSALQNKFQTVRYVCQIISITCHNI